MQYILKISKINVNSIYASNPNNRKFSFTENWFSRNKIREICQLTLLTRVTKSVRNYVPSITAFLCVKSVLGFARPHTLHVITYTFQHIYFYHVDVGFLLTFRKLIIEKFRKKKEVLCIITTNINFINFIINMCVRSCIHTVVYVQCKYYISYVIRIYW